MTINQDNKIRVIINGGEQSGNDWVFTLTTPQVEATGLLSVGVTIDDPNNEISVFATPFDEPEKESYTIKGGYLKVGSLIFDNLVDGGVGLDLAETKDLGSEENSDAYFAAFDGTKTIEIALND